MYDLTYFEEKRRRREVDFQASNWGAPDNLVYAGAKEYLSEYRGEAPFLLILETVDTHIGGGRPLARRPARPGPVAF